MPGVCVPAEFAPEYARGLRSTRRSILSLGPDGVVSSLSGGDCNTPSHIDYIVMLGVVYKVIQALPMLQELFLFRLQVRTTDLRGLGGMGWRLVGP